MAHGLTPEAKTTKEVRLAASSLDMTLMRNNTGMLYNIEGTPVRYGLGNESARLNKEQKFGDLVGWTKVEITPEMVGKTVAVFTAIEVKPEGKLKETIGRAMKRPDSREGIQMKTHNFILSNGGISWFATCAEDVEIIKRSYLGMLKK